MLSCGYTEEVLWFGVTVVSTPVRVEGFGDEGSSTGGSMVSKDDITTPKRNMSTEAAAEALRKVIDVIVGDYDAELPSSKEILIAHLKRPHILLSLVCRSANMLMVSSFTYPSHL